MIAKEIKIFKFLVILNSIASIAITHQIILYNLEYLDFKIYFISFYGFIWFFSLYKIYYFSKVGLKLYVLLVTFGFILSCVDPISTNALCNINLIYFLSKKVRELIYICKLVLKSIEYNTCVQFFD